MEYSILQIGSPAHDRHKDLIEVSIYDIANAGFCVQSLIVIHFLLFIPV